MISVNSCPSDSILLTATSVAEVVDRKTGRFLLVDQEDHGCRLVVVFGTTDMALECPVVVVVEGASDGAKVDVLILYVICKKM